MSTISGRWEVTEKGIMDGRFGDLRWSCARFDLRGGELQEMSGRCTKRGFSNRNEEERQSIPTESGTMSSIPSGSNWKSNKESSCCQFNHLRRDRKRSLPVDCEN